MSFCLVPEVLNAVDMRAFARDKFFPVIDAHMMIAFYGETIVPTKGIRVHDAVDLDSLLDDRNDRPGFGILDHLRVDLPSAL